MKRTLLLLLPCFCLLSVNTLAQRTVGLMKNTPEALAGYVLLSPINDTSVYLIDNCGQVTHRWHTKGRSGLSAYLLSDGSLLRPYQVPNAVFGQQGGGGIEKLGWNGNRIWQYKYSSPTYHQHHDICALPNGNVLLLAFELKTEAEAIAAGRKPTGAVWPEHIVEIAPIGNDSGRIVWEWHAWEHAIQNHDSTKANYGVVHNHPELLNLNYTETGVNTADWLHGNGLDYNPELDQIILSSRTFSEFFIIDHSTTTAEAATHTGGRYGKGGDILYRWGNPSTYGRGTGNNRTLYFQHNANWIKTGLKGAGNILVFNNGTNRADGSYSSVDEITPPIDTAGFYPTLLASAVYAPMGTSWRYTGEPRDSFYSPFISGAQRLPNGNTFICAGMSGKLIEVNDSGRTVWEYINPSATDGYITQGQPAINNVVFRAYKYPLTYAAFSGKTLTPNGYLELNPGTVDCTLYSGVNTLTASARVTATCYPNPANTNMRLAVSNAIMLKVMIYNTLGEVVYEANGSGLFHDVDCSKWHTGIYTGIIVTPNGNASLKVVKW